MNEYAFAQLSWRYAVRRFDPTKKLSEAQWKTLEHSLVMTASSFGLQPWKFIVVQNNELREKLKAYSFNNISQVMNSSHYVVLTAKERMDAAWVNRHIERMMSVRSVGRDTLAKHEASLMKNLADNPDDKAVREWGIRQCYIALGQLLATAAFIGVDACPMEGILPERYDEILGLNGTGMKTVLACALGFRSAEDSFSKLKKVRFDPKDVIDHR